MFQGFEAVWWEVTLMSYKRISLAQDTLWGKDKSTTTDKPLANYGQ
jgi:hypothetical protein